MPMVEEDHFVDVEEIDNRLENLNLEEKLKGEGRLEEEDVIENIEKEEKSTPILDIDLPGHLNNLNPEQRTKLLEMWSLVLGLLSSTTNSSNSNLETSSIKQNRELSTLLRERNLSTFSLSSQERMEYMRKHPLNEEFWSQVSTDHPDVMLLRWLRARKWNVDDAFAMFYEGLKWRIRFRVRNLLTEGEAGIKREIMVKGESYFWGLDRHNRLVIYLTARLHNRNAQTLEEICKYNVYQIEIGRRLFQPGAETVLLVFDLKDAPLSSLDFGSMQFMIQCLQSHYPESLGRCLILNAPWIFWGFYKLVKPLLDPVVVEKIIFIDDLEHLKTFIDDENLLKIYGGKAEYRYKYLPPPSLDNLESSSMSNSRLDTPTPSNRSSTISRYSSPSALSTGTPSSCPVNLKPNGPNVLSEEEIDLIYAQIEIKKQEFVDMTLVYFSKIQEINRSTSPQCSTPAHSPSQSASSAASSTKAVYSPPLPSIKERNEKDQVLGIFKTERDRLIKELNILFAKLDRHFYPTHLYERMGIFDPSDGSVVWKLPNENKS
jgi:hypothetical protein